MLVIGLFNSDFISIKLYFKWLSCCLKQSSYRQKEKSKPSRRKEKQSSKWVNDRTELTEIQLRHYYPHSATLIYDSYYLVW